MLTANQFKTAIIMSKRANCTGDESLEVAQTILALEKAYTEVAEAEHAAHAAEVEKKVTPQTGKPKATPKSRKK